MDRGGVDFSRLSVATRVYYSPRRMKVQVVKALVVKLKIGMGCGTHLGNIVGSARGERGVVREKRGNAPAHCVKTTPTLS